MNPPTAPSLPRQSRHVFATPEPEAPAAPVITEAPVPVQPEALRSHNPFASPSASAAHPPTPPSGSRDRPIQLVNTSDEDEDVVKARKAKRAQEEKDRRAQKGKGKERKEPSGAPTALARNPFGFRTSTTTTTGAAPARQLRAFQFGETTTTAGYHPYRRRSPSPPIAGPSRTRTAHPTRAPSPNTIARRRAEAAALVESEAQRHREEYLSRPEGRAALAAQQAEQRAAAEARQRDEERRRRAGSLEAVIGGFDTGSPFDGEGYAVHYEEPSATNPLLRHAGEIQAIAREQEARDFRSYFPRDIAAEREEERRRSAVEAERMVARVVFSDDEEDTALPLARSMRVTAATQERRRARTQTRAATVYDRTSPGRTVNRAVNHGTMFTHFGRETWENQPGPPTPGPQSRAPPPSPVRSRAPSASPTPNDMENWTVQIRGARSRSRRPSVEARARGAAVEVVEPTPASAPVAATAANATTQTPFSFANAGSFASQLAQWSRRWMEGSTQAEHGSDTDGSDL